MIPSRHRAEMFAVCHNKVIDLSFWMEQGLGKAVCSPLQRFRFPNLGVPPPACRSYCVCLTHRHPSESPPWDLGARRGTGTNMILKMPAVL